jgi:hypothetical protein
MGSTTALTTKRPYHENDLFRGDKSKYRLNACVGRNGGPWNFYDFSVGYFLAAAQIGEGLLQDSSRVDVQIYPLVYNFRHAIELSLKSLAKKLPRIWAADVDEIKQTHKLIDNWNAVKPYLLRDRQFDSDKTLIPVIASILKDFLEIDPTGEAFRYPTARNGDMHLERISLVNVVVLLSSMRTVRNAFEWWDNVANELWDRRVQELS